MLQPGAKTSVSAIPSVPAPRSRRILLGSTVLVAILVGAAVWWFVSRSSGKIDSVAVLPFTNVTGDPNSEYVSEGLTEDLISRLSQLPDLSVRPRSSVARYRGRGLDPAVAARELKVNGVASRQVTVHGDDLHVVAELVDTRGNRNLWSARYDVTLHELMSVRRELEDQVTTHVRRGGSSNNQAVRASTGGTSDPQAYQLYLKGRYYREKRTKENLDKAREYFEQAISRDPRYALAYVGMANYWSVVPDYSAIHKVKRGPESRRRPRVHSHWMSGYRTPISLFPPITATVGNGAPLKKKLNGPWTWIRISPTHTTYTASYCRLSVETRRRSDNCDALLNWSP